VWLLIGLLLASGYADLFGRFGGLGNGALYLQLMHGIGWLMIVLFGYLYFGLSRRPSRAVAANDTPAAAAIMQRTRPVMAINLSLGMLIIAVGISGPLWGL
jgi:uncharacterized membrane protein